MSLPGVLTQSGTKSKGFIQCLQINFIETFFYNTLYNISPFCGATDIPVLDFWWCLLWISKPEWVALFILGRGICFTHTLRFTSGATPTDLLAASMVAKLFSSMYLWADIGWDQNQDLSCCYCLKVSDQADALPTELCWLSLNWNFSWSSLKLHWKYIKLVSFC